VNKVSQFLIPVIAAGLLTACQPSDQDEGSVTLSAESSLEARVNYGLGYGYAEQLSQSGVALDAAAFSAGFEDALNGAASQLSEAELQAAFEAYQARMQEEAIAAQEAQATENMAEATAFLEENANAEGVITTASGLQYKVLEAGSGDMPSSASQVQVHYEGRLLDGTVFDSSYARGEPVEFDVSVVIPGWIEALQLMPEGSKWQLYVPPTLGFGPGGDGRTIGPNALLIFDVELLQANYQAPEAGAEAAE
jgi:FKBP-type peptidyl-prolyl cis-trans isomerase